MDDPQSFSVMTFNLRFGMADDGDNGWENRKKGLPLLFDRYRPDFIGFQEVNNFQADFLCGLLDGYGFIGRRNPSPDFWQNNLIFYRQEWVCTKEGHFFLSKTPLVESRLNGSRWPRQCVLGRFERKGLTVIMGNTHFDFSAKVQEESAILVLKLLSEFAPGLQSKLPTVITGDFNSTPGSSAHRIFMANGFEDSFQKSHSYTFHGFTGKAMGGHIDWILYRGGGKLLKRKIVRERFSGLFPSDHFPVVVEFTG
ncbi:MAG: endonuclease/exonuclease/phosphatase family protein [Desulfobacterium sp.]|jgi:endonuclease/exonuclease/phosphatase family metal-dependent hydrolase|nr:endonuclease/exonuclease/phosphatase family protein [Desulfobacterium sp.]